jgi:hypothetical protein
MPFEAQGPQLLTSVSPLAASLWLVEVLPSRKLRSAGGSHTSSWLSSINC